MRVILRKLFSLLSGPFFKESGRLSVSRRREEEVEVGREEHHLLHSNGTHVHR